MVTFVINLLILIANVSRNVERLVKRVDILILVELLYFFISKILKLPFLTSKNVHVLCFLSEVLVN